MGQEVRFEIVVTEKLSDAALNKLRGIGDVRELNRCDAATVSKAVGTCHALVVRTYTQVTADVIQSARNLKVIGRAGVGLDNIDLEAAERAGVRVVYTPAASTQAVAEMALGMLLSLERRINRPTPLPTGDAFRLERSRHVGRQLGELTAGIIGFGRIGQRFGSILHSAFGTKILYNDIRAISDFPHPATATTKEDIYKNADLITLHVPLTEWTHHLINEHALSLMRPTTLVINTARGAVVDANALADALVSEKIAGAAVDVYDPEPPDAAHPLLKASNCILTPHTASRTHTALAAMNNVVDEVITALNHS